MSKPTLSPEEITQGLSKAFSAPLIISTLGWIIYGANLSQFLTYLLSLSKKDHLLTKLWVTCVMIMTSAASFYQVYYDWTFSISLFEVITTDRQDEVSLLNGNSVALYSTVVVLVQLFWLACISRMMKSRPKLAWAIVTPIGFVSVSSFFIGTAVGALSNLKPGAKGSWPSPLISYLLRILLGFDLGVDLCILIVIIAQLTLVKSNSARLKKTISKLSWTLCAVTFLGCLVLIAELVVEIPEVGFGHTSININITFAAMISPIYCFGVLAVLNARTELWMAKREIADDLERNELIPGMNFTVDLPEANISRDIPLTNAHTHDIYKGTD